MRALRAGLWIVGLALLLLEIGLQAASLFAHDRSSAWRRDAHYTVLCMGDSHTYGAGVPLEEAYPAHLGRLLDAAAPGAYSVVNVGVPGMNTAQVRERLPDFVRRYEPDVILMWGGVNNSWNRAGIHDTRHGVLLRLDQLASHARTYRLARVWLHDRRLERDRAANAEGRAWEVADVENPFTGKEKFTLRRYDGVVETLQHDEAPELPSDTDWQASAEADYGAIIRYARASGIPIAFIAYPLRDSPVQRVANQALRNATGTHGVPLVDSEQAVARVPAEEQNFLWVGHPDGRMYGEIARDVAPVVLRLRPPE